MHSWCKRLYRSSFSVSEICYKGNLSFLTPVRIQFNKTGFKASYRFKLQVVSCSMVNDALKITRFLSNFLICTSELQPSFHSAAFALYFKLSHCGLVCGVNI